MAGVSCAVAGTVMLLPSFSLCYSYHLLSLVFSQVKLRVYVKLKCLRYLSCFSITFYCL